VEYEGKGENSCQLPIHVKLTYRVSRVRAEFSDKMKLTILKRKKLIDISKRMNQTIPNGYICYLTMHKLTTTSYYQ